MINIQKNIELSKYSTFRIGGKAREFVEVKNEKDLEEALEYAKEKKIKFFVLGGGSNVLFDDEGFGGLVIKLSADGSSIKISSEIGSLKGGEAFGNPRPVSVSAWAGENLSSLVAFCRENGISGMEWAVGIPGTIGGAIFGNAGAFEGSISDIVQSVRIFRFANFDFPSSDKKMIYPKKKCGFSYRESIFKNNSNLVILSAKFNLEKKNKEEIEKKMKENQEKRIRKQPKDWFGSAGSFFKNPIVTKPEIIKMFEEDQKTVAEDRRIPAGWLIEEAGLKGKSFGDILVSEINANFLINTGGGTAEEVVIAIGIIKQKVRIKFGIQLKEEVKIVYNN